MDTDERNEAEDRDVLPFGQHHAFIIGIDAYEHVATLETAVADARQLAEVLSAQQHFRVHSPLLDASGKDIRTLLHSTLLEQVGQDDRVFFYFAGHGIAADGDDGPAGYLVPADYDPTQVDTLIPMEELQKSLDGLPCRHLLLVLDCCFSGAFKWSSQYRSIGSLMPKKIYKERFDRFIEDPAWQVITSAAYDQKALDVLHGQETGERGRATAEDEDEEAHSPFAKALFEALSGEADVKVHDSGEGDGVITATELYAYIRDQVEPKTIEEGQAKRQTPGFFPLKKHDKGEFIFLHPQHRLNLPPIPKRSPYKGLEPFAEDDHLLFYGRARVIEELRDRLDSTRLLVVSGDSGSGKSSVVQAGLLPVLRAEGFRVLPMMRPGTHPLAALEEALAQAGVAPPRDGERPILVIDSFEEVITRCADPAERRLFEARLLEVLDGKRINRLVLTVRSDFEQQLRGGALESDWREGLYPVPDFTLEELKEAIVLPTLQEVLIFDPPELVDDIVGEVVQTPGAMPSLAHTLSELYEAYRTGGRQDRALKQEDYEKLGGVIGGLLTRARDLYDLLDHPHRATLRQVMLRMVSVEGELTSRRVPLAELDYSAEENARVEEVVERLVEARLVVKGADSIELAHPALVSTWRRLRDWVQVVGRDKLALREHLGPDAKEFGRTGNRAQLWYNKPELALATAELGNPQHPFNASEAAFIRASGARNKLLARLIRLGVGAALVAMLALSIWAVFERGIAEENAQTANDNARIANENALIAEENAREAEQEKERTLLGLFSDLDLSLSDGTPGSVCVYGLCDEAPAGDGNDRAWLALGRLPRSAPGFYPEETSRNFVAVRQYGQGHVLVYAHDGLARDDELLTSDNEPVLGSDNLLFTENALRWLTPSTEEEGCAEGVTIVLWQGTYTHAGNMLEVARFIQRRGWKLKVTGPETLEADLGCAEVLWYLSDWRPPLDFASRHVPPIERFVQNGGGLLVGGLGWSYAQASGPGQTAAVDPYSADELGEPFGFAFTEDAFQFSPGQFIPLLSTQ